MSAQWNDDLTLDDIFSDIERMTRERGKAEADADKPMHAWTLSEVDATTCSDTAVWGFSSGSSPV